MAEKRDGSKLSDWVEVAKEAASATDVDVVRALNDAMENWPIIIDVDGYGEDEQLTAAFGEAVDQLSAREQEVGGELAGELGILISALTAT